MCNKDQSFKNKKLLNQITSLMKDCGKMILDADREALNTQEKGGHANFVTDYDKAVEEKLREGLKEILPEAAFIGEESDNRKDGEYTFIVDPIDGTTNFIRDYKCSAISIALQHKGKTQLGLVYNPYLDELFTAVRGEGAKLNGWPIHVSNIDLPKAIIIFGTAPYCKDLHQKSLEIAGKYLEAGMDIRRSGSAALDLCSIACGRAELFFELELSPWDYAAGQLIVEEAGGNVTTFEGGELPYDRKSSLLASNKKDNIIKM